jgi:hypothetical protein
MGRELVSWRDLSGSFGGFLQFDADDDDDGDCVSGGDWLVSGPERGPQRKAELHGLCGCDASDLEKRYLLVKFLSV